VTIRVPGQWSAPRHAGSACDRNDSPITVDPLFVSVYDTVSPLQKWNVRLTVSSFTSAKNSGVRVIVPAS
jgi:hypothetical protein